MLKGCFLSALIVCGEPGQAPRLKKEVPLSEQGCSLDRLLRFPLGLCKPSFASMNVSYGQTRWRYEGSQPRRLSFTQHRLQITE